MDSLVTRSGRRMYCSNMVQSQLITSLHNALRKLLTNYSMMSGGTSQYQPCMFAIKFREKEGDSFLFCVHV